MTTWLRLLPLELDEVKEEELVEPRSPMDSAKDSEVGEASMDLKKLYTLWMRAEKEMHQIMFKLRFEVDDPLVGLEEAKSILRKLSDESDALKAIFWVSVKEEHNLWDKPSIGIRKGWKIVWFPDEDDEPNLPPGFKGFGFRF